MIFCRNLQLKSENKNYIRKTIISRMPHSNQEREKVKVSNYGITQGTKILKFQGGQNINEVIIEQSS